MANPTGISQLLSGLKQNNTQRWLELVYFSVLEPRDVHALNRTTDEQTSLTFGLIFRRE